MYILTSPLVVSFAGGAAGGWRVDRIEGVRGSRLEEVPSLGVIEGSSAPIPPDASWVLRGVTSNERYTTQHERAALLAVQAPLGRPEATRAALIPIKKSADWWALPQEKLRAIFEAHSLHAAFSLALPLAIPR